MRNDYGPDSGLFLRSTERGQAYQALIDYHGGGVFPTVDYVYLSKVDEGIAHLCGCPGGCACKTNFKPRRYSPCLTTTISK